MPSILLKEIPQLKAGFHFNRATQLVNYVKDEEKCIAQDMLNMDAPDGDFEMQALEIALACDLADRTEQKKLIGHWILSFKTADGEERPSAETAIAAAKEAMELIGYGKCPMILTVHGNTDNLHCHIVGPRIDAETGKIIRDSFSHMKAQRAVAQIAARHGWGQERGDLYRVVDGELQFIKKAERTAAKLSAKTLEAESMTGMKSAQRMLGEALADFCDANRASFKGWRWGDLHKALAQQGIAMQYTEHAPGRGGLAFSLDGKTWEKASKACPELGFRRIQEAMGAGSYRKARKGIEPLLQAARAARSDAPQPMPPRQKPEKEKRDSAPPKEPTQAEINNAISDAARERQAQEEADAAIESYFERQKAWVENLKERQAEELRVQEMRAQEERQRQERQERERKPPARRTRPAYLQAAIDAEVEKEKAEQRRIARQRRLKEGGERIMRARSAAAVKAHMREIAAAHPNATPAQARAMLALRLRGTGRTRKEVESILNQAGVSCARQAAAMAYGQGAGGWRASAPEWKDAETPQKPKGKDHDDFTRLDRDVFKAKPNGAEPQAAGMDQRV